MTNPPNVREGGAVSVRATGQAPAAPSGRRPTLTAVPDRPLGPKGVAPYYGPFTDRGLLAHNDPHADGPDAGDFLRQEKDALRREQPRRANVYWLCARREFGKQQAEARALTLAREHGPLLPPVA